MLENVIFSTKNKENARPVIVKMRTDGDAVVSGGHAVVLVDLK